MLPPPSSASALERILDRLTPAPEPPLKMIPTSVYQLRIERIESSTERMKHALPCCGHVLHPDVEPHWRVEGGLCVMSRCFNSARNVSVSSSSTK